MRSILKSCYKFLPLFLGVVCISLLVVALVPGQLEYASDIIQLLRSFNSVLNSLLVGMTFAGILTLILLTIYDLRQILSNRRNKLKFPPTPGLTSLSILIGTWLLIQIHLPARLWFYTSSDRFEQALVQPQTLEDGNCQGTKKVGNIKILTTVVYGEDNPSKNAIYFYTMSDGICHGLRMFQDPNSYGFAYLPNHRGTDWMDITHIYGKWYIFHENTSTGG